MPDAETLMSLSLKQFESSTQASDLVSKTVTEILSQLSRSTSHAGELQEAGTKLVLTGPGLPVLPKKMVEKIRAGQYIDFSRFPPGLGHLAPMLCHLHSSSHRHRTRYGQVTTCIYDNNRKSKYQVHLAIIDCIRSKF